MLCAYESNNGRILSISLMARFVKIERLQNDTTIVRFIFILPNVLPVITTC